MILYYGFTAKTLRILSIVCCLSWTVNLLADSNNQPETVNTNSLTALDSAIDSSTNAVTNTDPTIDNSTDTTDANAPAGYSNNNLSALNNNSNTSNASDLQQIQHNSAFNSVLQQAMPLTPQEIAELKYLYSKTQRASAATAGIPPKPTSSTQLVNLAPGAIPPVIRLSQGFITSMVFIDATGAPWPIISYDLGNPQAFNIQWDKVNNILMVQAKSPYTYGNLAVKLQALSTPVMVTLIPGQQIIDYRVDLRIQQLGPKANQSVETNGLPDQANPTLLGILDGIPPDGSQLLTVPSGQAQAWLFNNKLFLRTRVTILSPAWISIMSSADGTHAYELQKTPTLLISNNGKVEQLKIEGL